RGSQRARLAQFELTQHQVCQSPPLILLPSIPSFSFRRGGTKCTKRTKCTGGSVRTNAACVKTSPQEVPVLPVHLVPHMTTSKRNTKHPRFTNNGPEGPPR